MTFPLVFSLSYESFAKVPLTWQDNRSPWAGATTAINEEGEIGDRISAQHRAKETALDAVTMQITAFAGGDVAPQYLGHGGGRGIKRMMQPVWSCRRERDGLSSSTGK